MTQTQAKNLPYFQFLSDNVPINCSELLGANTRNKALDHSFKTIPWQMHNLLLVKSMIKASRKLERVKHCIFTLHNRFSCSVMNEMCLNLRVKPILQVEPSHGLIHAKLTIPIHCFWLHTSQQHYIFHRQIHHCHCHCHSTPVGFEPSTIQHLQVGSRHAT